MDAARERFILDFIQTQKEYRCINESLPKHTLLCLGHKVDMYTSCIHSKKTSRLGGGSMSRSLPVLFCCGVLHFKIFSPEDPPWLWDSLYFEIELAVIELESRLNYQCQYPNVCELDLLQVFQNDDFTATERAKRSLGNLLQGLSSDATSLGDCAFSLSCKSERRKARDARSSELMLTASC